MLARLSCPASPDTHHWQLHCGTSTSRGLPSLFFLPSAHVLGQLTALVPEALYIATLQRKRWRAAARCLHCRLHNRKQALHLHAHHVQILVLYWHPYAFASTGPTTTVPDRSSEESRVLLTAPNCDSCMLLAPCHAVPCLHERCHMACQSDFTFALF